MRLHCIVVASSSIWQSSRNRQTLTEHSVKVRPFRFPFTVGKCTLIYSECVKVIFVRICRVCTWIHFYIPELNIETSSFNAVFAVIIVFKIYTLAEGDDAKIGVILAKFDEHFVPKRNIIHKRARFHERNQNKGETVESFVRNLYELAEHCDFGTGRNQQIRDRIVIGILD